MEGSRSYMVVIASYRWVPPLMSVALVGWAYWKAGARRSGTPVAELGVRTETAGERTSSSARRSFRSWAGR